jgi:hypothetical protein
MSVTIIVLKQNFYNADWILERRVRTSQIVGALMSFKQSFGHKTLTTDVALIRSLSCVVTLMNNKR